MIRTKSSSELFAILANVLKDEGGCRQELIDAGLTEADLEKLNLLGITRQGSNGEKPTVQITEFGRRQSSIYQDPTPREISAAKFHKRLMNNY